MEREEAIKIVKSHYPANKQMLNEALEFLIPELKESEDERIRKTLLESFEYQIKESHPDKEWVCGVKLKEIVSWLEKQKSVGEIVERCKNSWYNEGKIAGMFEGLTDDEKYQQGWHDALEKQGKQKVSVDDFKAKNWYVSEVDGKIHDMTYNPTDKDEPKFKVGDWIIRSAEGFKHNTYLITEVKDYYVCEELKGRRVTFTFNDVHNNFKLWDISDAKDGDVLVVPSIEGSEYSEQIFIFKEIKDRDYVKNAVEYYCRVFDNEFWLNERGFMGQSDDYFVPATKEQRDLLFQKMKEDGYEWDAEKKELKKIHVIDEGKAEMDYCFTKMMAGEKANPAWSVEDSSKVQRICKYLDEAKKYYADITEVRECMDWLKSLEERVQPKPTEWSEDDEENLQHCCGAIGAADYYTYDDKQEMEKWLLQLKERLS